MPRQARQLAESQIYHVMVRGVNRDAIFLEDEDYQRFLDALDQTREASGCVVLAYCLMSNHVHLVLRTPGEPISAVAKRLGVRYAGWFNRKYGRVGHVFQDRFRSLPVETDEYLVTLVHYVWNNPVEAGLVEDPREYPWSSRRFLVGGSSLVDVAALLRLVPSGAFESDAAPVSLPAFIPAVIGRPITAGIKAGRDTGAASLSNAPLGTSRSSAATSTKDEPPTRKRRLLQGYSRGSSTKPASTGLFHT